MTLAFLSDEIGWLLQLGFVQSAFVYKMDCLDSHESVLFFLRHRLKAVYLSLPFPIMLFYIFPPQHCLFCLQAMPGYISPVSQSALSSRDDALGPLYHGCLVDHHCFLFTGWCSLLNPLPSLHHLHCPPSFFFSLCVMLP